MIKLTMGNGRKLAVRADLIRSVTEESHAQQQSNGRVVETSSVVFMEDGRQLQVVEEFFRIVEQIEKEEK